MSAYVEAYVEAIGSAYGWVWIDARGYGHRSSAYAPRWAQLGGSRSGWVQNADGSFTSERPLPSYGYPLDPSLPPPGVGLAAPAVAPGFAFPWAVVLGGIVIGWYLERRGRA